MFLKLFLAFTLIPILELYILIKIGTYLGAFNTIMIVILTGILGAYLAKSEGYRTVAKIRESLNNGVLPAEEMIDALLIFIAGALLLTPGILTDLSGILLLIPFTRKHFKIWLRKKFDRWIEEKDVRISRYF